MHINVRSRFYNILLASGLLSLSSHAMASAFQLWEQDGASIGNYHAGYAAEANDASIAWYNPAGITRIHDQELVVGSAVIVPDFKYRGTVSVTELQPTLIEESPFIVALPVTQTFNNVYAQGGTFNVVPNLHYVAPISDRLGFGISITAPFGLKTDYGRSTPLRYAATLTSITVADISPSLGIRILENASIGAGFDVQKASAEFDNVATALILNPPDEPNATDTESSNHLTDTGYGYHLGALYEFTPNARIGMSYHSQVVHHFTGSSKFVGPIADSFNNDAPLETSRANARVTLPPYTAFSFYNRVNPCWSFMGSVIYTQWNTFNTITLNQVAGLINTTIPPFFTDKSNDIQVIVPEHYRNSWNLSIGSDYFVTDTITLKAGLGWDQSPVRNAYRNVELPDNDRYIVALGGHVQATKNVGLDVGWSHIFVRETHVNPPPQAMGAQTVSTTGTVKGGADVFATQITWDMT